MEVAQQEHDAFAEALRGCGTEVLYLEDLMAEVIGADTNLRDQFLDQWLTEAGIHTPYWRAKVLDLLLSDYAEPKALVEKTMTGICLSEFDTVDSGALIDLIAPDDEMVIDPMPNLYFTRDPFAMVGNGVTIHRMYSITRNRETIYGKYIFDNHPDYKDVPQYYDRSWAFRIEGGDVLNLNEHVLAIGISQRTEPDAIDTLAANIFNDETSSIDTILAFDIPSSRAFMHLDTVFTQIDRDKFTIHPGILGPLRVFELKPDGKGGVKTTERNTNLEDILSEHLGTKVELLMCGAGNRIAAEREQWNDGSNTLCVEPGKIVVYQRNNVTNAYLDSKGLDLVVVPSAELSRGRGGPRCMSMPFWREDLA